jgi:hypothetical protein
MLRVRERVLAGNRRNCVWMALKERDEDVPAQCHGWSALGDAHAELFGPLSPELALVSPELAHAARMLLPDRPWELFAPPVPLEPAADTSTVPLPVSVRPVPAAAPAAVPLVLEPLVAPVPTVRRRRFRRPSTGALVWGALGALVLFSSLPIVIDGPSLGGAAPADNPPPSGQSSGGVTPHPGAYVGDQVRLVVGADARTIVSRTVNGLCGSRATVGDIPVAPDGQFAATRNDGAARVSVQGRFRSPELGALKLRVVRASCDSRPRSFTVRIS